MCITVHDENCRFVEFNEDEITAMNSAVYVHTRSNNVIALSKEAAILACDEWISRLNAVCVGTIRTPLVDRLFKEFAVKENKTLEQYWEQENFQYIRKKAGTPEEVAEMVYFLASRKSSFCNGSHFLCDGGLLCK